MRNNIEKNFAGRITRIIDISVSRVGFTLFLGHEGLRKKCTLCVSSFYYVVWG